MISRFLILGILLITVSCKDNTQVVEKESENLNNAVAPVVKKKKSLENFYKVQYSSDGDTLLPYIPQDSVAIFFTRYGLKNPETKVRITTNYGTIDMELFTETPLYRASFIFLVKNKYFDQTAIYRVVPEFVVQAGNSYETLPSLKRNSTGNYKLPPQFINNLTHERGSLSLAKEWKNNPENWHNPFDFFITLKKSPHLDGEHTIFGKVTNGMDVADQISLLERDESDWPLKDVYISMEVMD
jgi:peptidylprolyl isomerase